MSYFKEGAALYPWRCMYYDQVFTALYGILIGSVVSALTK